MEPTRPKCPVDGNVLLYEPASSAGPERVYCLVCGWSKLREVVPVMAPVPLDSDKVVPERVKYGFQGTCPACHRPDMVLISKSGPCSRCYKRIAKGIDPLAVATRLMPAEKPVVKVEVPAAPVAVPEPIIIATPIQPQEAPMSEPTVKKAKKVHSYKGTCKTCQRPNMKLGGPAGDCSRCWWRKKNGKDPLGERPNSLEATKAKAAQPCPAPAAPAAVPPPIQPEAAPAPRSTAATVCVLKTVLEQAMGDKIALWLQELAEEKPGKAIMRASRMIEAIEALEC